MMDSTERHMLKLAFNETMGQLYLLLVDLSEDDFKRIANDFSNCWIDRWIDPEDIERMKKWAKRETDRAWFNGVKDDVRNPFGD